MRQHKFVLSFTVKDKDSFIEALEAVFSEVMNSDELSLSSAMYKRGWSVKVIEYREVELPDNISLKKNTVYEWNCPSCGAYNRMAVKFGSVVCDNCDEVFGAKEENDNSI